MAVGWVRGGGCVLVFAETEHRIVLGECLVDLINRTLVGCAVDCLVGCAVDCVVGYRVVCVVTLGGYKN